MIINGQEWAKDMQELFKETYHKVSKSKKKKLDYRNYNRACKKYREILADGKKEIPEIPCR